MKEFDAKLAKLGYHPNSGKLRRSHHKKAAPADATLHPPQNKVPDRNSIRDVGLVVLHDLHLRKAAPPQGLYNAAQKIAYTGVIVMAMGSVVTGLAIYKPAQLSWLASLLGGYQMARWEHFLLMIGFVGFFFMHIAQVVRAGWDNFRSMVAGYSLHTDGSSNEQSND